MIIRGTFCTHPVRNPIKKRECSPEASRYHPLSCVAFEIYLRQYGKSQVSLTSARSQLVKFSGQHIRLSGLAVHHRSGCVAQKFLMRPLWKCAIHTSSNRGPGWKGKRDYPLSGNPFLYMEAASGVEPLNNGFADHCLSHLATPPCSLVMEPFYIP